MHALLLTGEIVFNFWSFSGFLLCFRFVTLDGPLTDLLLSKGEIIESFRWDELLNRCQSKMGPAYQITFPGKQPALKKGKPDPVVINVVQRAGNKKVRAHGRYR